MISLTREARRHVRELNAHYRRLGRPEAVRNLMQALTEASNQIESGSKLGLRTPGPYPGIARPGRLWVKSGRYWIAYRTKAPVSIVGVFFETADIPRRI